MLPISFHYSCLIDVLQDEMTEGTRAVPSCSLLRQQKSDRMEHRVAQVLEVRWEDEHSIQG